MCLVYRRVPRPQTRNPLGLALPTFPPPTSQPLPLPALCSQGPSWDTLETRGPTMSLKSPQKDHSFGFKPYSPLYVDRIWLWVYYNKIPVYPRVCLLAGDYNLNSRSFDPATAATLNVRPRSRYGLEVPNGSPHVSYTLNSLKGGYVGDYIGDNYWDYHSMTLDYRTCCLGYGLAFRHLVPDPRERPRPRPCISYFAQRKHVCSL